MKDTCTPENCFFTELLNNREQCPNYMRSGWREKEGCEPYELHDCAPKRILSEMQIMKNLLLKVLKTSQLQRNEAEPLIEFVQLMKQYTTEKCLNDTKTEKTKIPL